MSTVVSSSSAATLTPVSSSTSRAAASATVSPSSWAPPGRLQWPWRGGRPRRTSSTRSPCQTTTPTPTTGRSGYSRPPLIYRNSVSTPV